VQLAPSTAGFVIGDIVGGGVGALLGAVARRVSGKRERR
jgi:hypothetical protein